MAETSTGRAAARDRLGNPVLAAGLRSRLCWPSQRHRCGAARKGSTMTEPTANVRNLLHEAAETHHQVYRITDGADDDWATWYADWLVRLSELPSLLGRRPTRSELTYQLVLLAREHDQAGSDQSWEDFYAER